MIYMKWKVESGKPTTINRELFSSPCQKWKDLLGKEDKLLFDFHMLFFLCSYKGDVSLSHTVQVLVKSTLSETNSTLFFLT